MAAGVDIAILFYLLKYHQLNLYIAATISFIIATVTNYVLCINLVFMHANRTKTNFMQTFLVSGLGLGFHHSLLFLFYNFITLPLVVSKLGAMALVFLWNFLSRKYWVFSSKGHAQYHNMQNQV